MTKKKTDLSFYLIVCFIALIVLSGSFYLLQTFGVITFRTSGPTPTPTISAKNRAPAKAALNAIGEVNSVTSVGSNYLQFTQAVQSAKIKYDAAMRDFESQSTEDIDIQHEFTAIFVCYMDAKDAWSEFIEDGNEFGFLAPQKYSSIPKLAATYGIQPVKDKDDPKRIRYFRGDFLGAILRQASGKFNALQTRIMEKFEQ